MATPQKRKVDKSKSQVLTPEFRVSYPHVFKPQAIKPGDAPKYSITMLFPKTTDLSALRTAMKEAKIAKYGPKENWPDDLQSPVIDGDNPKYADKEGYKGHWVIKASSKEDQKPNLVDQNVKPILDPSQFYPGCFARAYVFATCWEYMGKSGVMLILDHVQKLRDGQAFGGKKPADQVFTPVAVEDADDADTDDDDDDFM